MFAVFETDEADDAKMPGFIDDPRVTMVAGTAVDVDLTIPQEERKYYVSLSLSGPTLSASVRKPNGETVELAWQTR